MINRRDFIRRAMYTAGTTGALSLFSSIERALGIPAALVTGSISDVQHVVILMQENRSFNHYFGSLRGVRGFGDRHAVPLESGKSVWHQSDGIKEICPFRLNTKQTSALRVPTTPHSFGDAQAAWNQGKSGYWPKFKSPISMGHYLREDIPFQFALAEAFTICDAYHCSVTTGTDPNRIVFWSGSNFNPELRSKGENCTDNDSEPDNLRCWVTGALPSPGYTYQGSSFRWPTIPEVLEEAGITWRIYQNPNDNYTGAMHGCLAFENFRKSRPGEALFEKGMTHRSLEQLADDVKSGALPQVSWVLPPKLWSEHPDPSSPLQGAEFTSQVLDALTSDPHVWGRTVFFLTFDENDGQFDHVPPPAVPSYNTDGTLAGKSTVELAGEYFFDKDREYILQEDHISGEVRPWGLGPRVPMYVISPWSRGGWVNSQVFDHTSVAQFLERRFGVTVPAISPWHRAVSGDLTSAFDFKTPNREPRLALPEISNSAAVIATISHLPAPSIPSSPERLFQEPGVRRSRELPYEMHVHAYVMREQSVLRLSFQNTGHAGAVFHVYNMLHLDRIPRRYTVEGGKQLSDEFRLEDDRGQYHLWIYGPNGFLREFRGLVQEDEPSQLEAELEYVIEAQSVRLVLSNHSHKQVMVTVHANAHRTDGPWSSRIEPGSRIVRELRIDSSHCWYDFTVRGPQCERRFAGRMETNKPSFSDPAMAVHLEKLRG